MEFIEMYYKEYIIDGNIVFPQDVNLTIEEVEKDSCQRYLLDTNYIRDEMTEEYLTDSTKTKIKEKYNEILTLRAKAKARLNELEGDNTNG